MNDTPDHHPAALAGNWRSILGIDILLGLAAVVVGVILAVGSHLGVGIVLSLLGMLYVTMVALRARKWSRMRRDAEVHD